MDKPQNKYITASYQLYSFDENGNRHLEEETQQGRPFQFISGFGMALDAFEKNIVDLEPGTKFDFELAAADGFGEYDPEGVHQMGRDVFTVNGQFDTENIFEGAVITMMNADERRFMARVVEITDNHVTIDTNHPLAGQKLQFTGTILENRDATNEEILQMVNYLSGEGCGCGCDDCGDGCGKHEKGGCGCGHCHQ